MTTLAADRSTADLFAAALGGERCWVRGEDGRRHRLPTRRWFGCGGAAERRFDRLLVDGCDGPTVDLGCGPGRLVAALARRGVAALGIDLCAGAVAAARRRGAVALQRDIFATLPGEGRWHYALLADGNLGIGGDPVRILARTRELLRPGGIAVVEFERRGFGLRRAMLRLESDHGVGPWFPWTRVGVEYAADVARGGGLRVLGTAAVADRHVAWLGRLP